MTPQPLSFEVTAPYAAATAAVAALLGVLVLMLRRLRRRAATARAAEAGAGVRRLLVAVAIAGAVGVAVIGGVRSFEAVSDRFGSPLVPLTADGMIVACTALRIAALTKGWRIPGALVTTYVFIGGTVWLNVAAAHDTPDAVAHALAPLSYAVLVEMLAHLLRLHLRLAAPPRLRRPIAALAWLTSPVISTRVWLHLARTGSDDPAQARALVQQLIRLSSRLQAVCPSSRPWPFGQARRARTAALQVVRDGLLQAHELADLLPADGERIAPAVLLARIDQAALHRTASTRTGAPLPTRTGAVHRPLTTAPEQPLTGAVHRPLTGAPGDSCTGAPNGVTTYPARSGAAANGTPKPTAGAERSDEELIAELVRIGGPWSGRQVMKRFGVGTGRAKRLIEQARQHQATPETGPANSTPKPADPKQANAESDSTDQAEGRTTR